MLSKKENIKVRRGRKSKKKNKKVENKKIKRMS
jgi:hypothetical protein